MSSGCCTRCASRTELEPDEEAIELGFRQREGALVLDRVLGGHDEERVGQLVGRPVDGDLALLHRLEECGLGLWRRAVDLVGEDDLAHHRAGPELERVALLVEDRDAGDVGRQEVRGELDAPEAAAERTREGLREDGLAGPGNVFDEDVPAAEERDDRELDLVVLAEDDPFNVLDHAGDLLGKPSFAVQTNSP